MTILEKIITSMVVCSAVLSAIDYYFYNRHIARSYRLRDEQDAREKAVREKAAK